MLEILRELNFVGADADNVAPTHGHPQTTDIAAAQVAHDLLSQLAQSEGKGRPRYRA